MADVSGVTKHFITGQEGFTTTLASTISSGATTVPLNSVSGYADGEQVALVVEPTDASKKQVFTGTIDTAGVQVTGVEWTEGTNQTHNAGVTVVDYWTATHQAALVKGMKVSHDDDGTLKAGAVDNTAVLADDVVTRTKVIEASQIEMAGSYAPQGYMVNGKIETSVATNDLTVAIKTLAGTNPSSSDPVYIRIGNTVRTITSALSVTKNDGTNWFNSGSAGLATYEVDYFVYMGYNATDGVTIGFARIPYARVYGDFSATTTNDRYCAISTVTNASSTDEYEVVGRFNATLSATASFNWSIPGTSIVINRPIFETRWLGFDLQMVGFSALPSQRLDRYRIGYDSVYVNHNDGQNGTSNTTTLTGTAPITAKQVTDNFYAGVVWSAANNSAPMTTPGRAYISSVSPSTIVVDRDIASTAWTASGQKGSRFFLEYEI